LIAASLLRRFWTNMPKTSPSSSTARQSHIRWPPMRTAVAQIGRVQRAEFDGPATDRFITHLDCALGEQFPPKTLQRAQFDSYASARTAQLVQWRGEIHGCRHNRTRPWPTGCESPSETHGSPRR
jgi:hypothetical protein